MHIQNAPRKRQQHRLLQPPHESGTDHEIHPRLLQQRRHLFLSLVAQPRLERPRIHEVRCDAPRPRLCQNTRVRDIRNHQHDLRVQLPTLHCRSQRPHIRSRTASNHTEAWLHRVRRQRIVNHPDALPQIAECESEHFSDPATPPPRAFTCVPWPQSSRSTHEPKSKVRLPSREAGRHSLPI